MWLPLASPLAAVSALAFAAGEVIRARARAGGPLSWVADVLPSAAAAVVISELALFLPALFGAYFVPVSAALVGVILSPAASAALDAGAPGRLRPGLALLAAAGIAALAQAPFPQATASSPERLALVYHEGEGRARWVAEGERAALPPAVGAAAPFSRERAPAFPWTPHSPAFSAPAPALRLSPPRIEVLSSEVRGARRLVRVRVSSPRGAPVVSLVLFPGSRIASAALDGLPLPPPSPLALRQQGSHRVLTSMTTPPRGFTVEPEIEGVAPLEAVASDRSPGLPPQGAALAAARPESAVTSWDGDGTVVTARAWL